MTLVSEGWREASGPPSSASPHLASGDRVDRYVVRGLIGEGASARVYRVEHETLGSHHALKVLKDTDARRRARHLNEGRLLAGWDHPNIVRVLDAFPLQGAVALVLELVDGPTLAERIARAPLTPAEAESVFRQMLAAVGYAHARGVVHRDLKPANVMLLGTADALEVKVADFGVARQGAHQLSSDEVLTRTGHTLGTPAYMAPELVGSAAEADTRSDLFSLGVILYEMCAGVRPFQGRGLWGVLDALRRDDRAPLLEVAPDTPAHLARAVDACLIPDPSRRVPDTRALLGVLDGADWVGAADTPPARPRRWPAAAALGACALAVGALAWPRPPEPEPPVDTSQAPRLAAALADAARERERGALTRAAFEERARDPARALSLLRASASLSDDPDRALARASTYELVARGALARELTAHEQVGWVRASRARDLIVGVTLDARVLVWRLSDGALLHDLDTGLDRGRLHTRVDDAFTHLAVATNLSENASEHPRAVKVYDLAGGRLAYTLAQSVKTVLGGFSSRGDVVTRALYEGDDAHEHVLRLWDARFGGERATFDLGEGRADLAFGVSPDGRWSVHALRDRSSRGRERLLVVDHDTSEVSRVPVPPPMHYKEPGALVFSNSEDVAYASFFDTTLAISLATGETLGRTRAPTGRLSALSEARGALLFGDESLGLTLARTPDLTPIATLTPERGRFYDLASLERLGLFATAETNHGVSLWSAVDGALERRLDGHSSWVLAAAPVEGDGPDMLATGGRDAVVRLWSLAHVAAPLPRPAAFDRAGSARWSPDGHWLAATSARDVLVWSHLDASPARHTLPADAVALRWAGDLLLADTDGERASQTCVITPAVDAPLRCGPRVPPSASIHPVGDGAFMECLMAACTLRSPGQEPRTLFAQSAERPAMIGHLTVSPRRDAFTLSGRPGTLHALSLSAPEWPGEAWSLAHQHVSVVRDVDPLDALLVGFWDDGLELRSRDGGRLLWSRDLSASVFRVLLPPGSGAAVVALADGDLHVIDLATGASRHVLEGHSHEVVSLTMAKDDRLITLSKDRTLRAWSLTTGALIAATPAPRHARRVVWRGGEVIVLTSRGHAARLGHGALSPLTLARSGAATNLRVCRGDLSVVAVSPWPDPDSVWAPDSQCPGDGTE